MIFRALPATPTLLVDVPPACGRRHPVGSYRIGPDGDSFAVVSPQLRAHGLDGLQVVDASVMPDTPGGKPKAPTAKVAEKAADLLRGAGRQHAATAQDLRTVSPLTRLRTPVMNRSSTSSRTQRPSWSALALVLAMATPPGQAAVIFTNNILQADTSVSELRTVSESTAGGASFDRAVQSQGLGVQGQVSLASASLKLVVDPEHGASGSMETSLTLGSGASGEAAAGHQTAFEVEQRSRVNLGALFEAFGNGGSQTGLRLSHTTQTGDFIATILEADLDASPVLDFSALLDPGFYLFEVGSLLRNGDTGEQGGNRLQFSLRFDEASNENQVPEPSTLALALLALWTTRAWRGSRG